MVNIEGIERWQDSRADFYKGTAEQLIAAGLVRADQFPPARADWVTFLNGALLRSRHSYRMDERYLRVQRWGDRKAGIFCVWIGLSAAVRKERRDNERATFNRARASAARSGAQIGNVISLAAFRASRLPVSLPAREVVALGAKVNDAKTRAEVLRQIKAEVRGEIHTARLGLGNRPRSAERVVALQAFLAELDERHDLARRHFEEREKHLLEVLDHDARARGAMGRN